MDETKYTKEFLEELRALPLYRKVQLTQNRIIEWYQHFNGDVCISFSGGKDSTVLLHIARQIFPNIKAVFSNTGLEYPEIQAFVMKQQNVDIVRPKMQFPEVISTYGYPLISKEVAEAIYYARRIIPKTDVERGREQSQSMDQEACAGRAERRDLETAVSASRNVPRGTYRRFCPMGKTPWPSFDSEKKKKLESRQRCSSEGDFTDESKEAHRAAGKERERERVWRRNH